MERQLYRDHEQQEERHWWFLGRRRIISTLLSRLGLGTDRRILDIGSGAGGMLEALLPYGRVTSMEGDAESAEHIRQRYGENVMVIHRFFDGTEGLPETYDLVTMFDVLEHIEDDATALANVYGLLPPGGILVLTVPAFPILWSGHDVLNRHFRRYRKGQLRRRVEQAGFRIQRLGFFNFMFFFPILLVRLAFRALHRTESDFRVPSAGMNAFFLRIFAAERFIVTRGGFPFGVSLFCVATKPT
jgi:SAM-dependent methyltransferase